MMMPETKTAKKRAAKKRKVARNAKPKASHGPSAKTRARRDALAPERVAAILKGLDEAYPEAECALNHRNPWELLVATILSAQCTDVRVNMVTPELFRRFPTPEAMAKASLPELEELIKSTGFFRNKANRSREQHARSLPNSTARYPKRSPN
jgi:endonuclease-3